MSLPSCSHGPDNWEQLSGLPTFGEDKSVQEWLQARLTVRTKYVRKRARSLENGVLTEVLTTVTRQLIVNSGKNLIIEQLLVINTSENFGGDDTLPGLKRVLFAKQDDRHYRF